MSVLRLDDAPADAAEAPGPAPERYVTRPVRPVAQLLVRVGLWAAVALGCLGGIVALLRPGGGGGEPAADQAAEQAGVPAPVAGVAELAVREWLTATDDGDDGQHGDGDGEGDGDGDRLASLFVEPPEPHAAGTAGSDVERVTAVAGRAVGDGFWVVTVAADVVEVVDAGQLESQSDEADTATGSDAGAAAQPRRMTWYVEIGIVGDVGGRLAALATPGVLPGPQGPPDGWGVALGAPQEAGTEDPLRVTVEAFLEALLAGQGEVSRYVRPGTDVTAADPPPFAAVVVEQMATQEMDDDRVRVLVRGRATTPGGVEQAVSYELVAVPRVDRWEIADISGVPTAVRQAEAGS